MDYLKLQTMRKKMWFFLCLAFMKFYLGKLCFSLFLHQLILMLSLFGKLYLGFQFSCYLLYVSSLALYCFLFFLFYILVPERHTRFLSFLLYTIYLFHDYIFLKHLFSSADLLLLEKRFPWYSDFHGGKNGV